MSQTLHLLSTPETLPKPASAEKVATGFAEWRDRAVRQDDPDVAAFMSDLVAEPRGEALLSAVFGNSPFLTHCTLQDPASVRDLLQRGPEAVLGEVRHGLAVACGDAPDIDAAKTALRVARRTTALGVALADIAGHWDLERVTAALSDFADASVDAALAFLLKRAAGWDDLELPEPAHPTTDCGITVLGLGKLGARELNYSSDIDLIVLYETEQVRYRGRKDVHEFCVRLTRQLVELLEEKTRDGYVARVDLRLRPDPSAMPLAIPVSAAETYYESLGQNWERAAMIKARACAGDRRVGQAFLRSLRPFVWRKHLDFWAIQDVHSIKRQIYAHRGGSTVAVAGHNIKLGRGGIREIEFYAQTQQLIWGGRDPDLRTPRTVEALHALARAGHITKGDAEALSEAYVYLRQLEHRLQMIEDRQTQTLPEDDEGVAEVAAFMGYNDATAFQEDLLRRLLLVEDRYAALFEEEPSLSDRGNLVFTGGEPDPDTLETLSKLGFRNGERVFNIVANWHRGRYRAVRSRRARELLTELIPTLLEALGRTAHPDAALSKFDEFLAGLPAGVQLFSMLHANPKLLDLLASIVGAAPALAEHLSRWPGLLEAVLDPDFFAPIPDRGELAADLQGHLRDARDFQDVLDVVRRWVHDRKFQVGVHMLEHTADVDEVGRALSDVAEAALEALHPHVTAEFAQKHGYLDGPGMAVLAMGKLGGRELTISSDLDLVFLAETADGVEESDGPKRLDPGRYLTRLAQRFINAMTAPTAEGQLYEVDMRLRPSGASGPLVGSLSGFRRYYENDAWTWEHMALTRARPVIGDPDFRERIGAEMREILTAPRDPGKLFADVVDMRERIAREHPPRSDWHVKYLRGGLVDLEFLAQTLQLRHAHEHPEVLAPGTQEAFRRLGEASLLDRAEADELIAATRLMRHVQGLLRLMSGDDFDEAQAPEGLKAQLAQACGAEDFEDLRRRVLATAESVHHIFARLVEAPAAAARAAAETPEQGTQSEERQT